MSESILIERCPRRFGGERWFLYALTMVRRSPIDRARLRLEKAQRQIEAGCRKGMRKTTYQRLLRQYEAAQENYDLLFLKEARKLQLLNEKRQNKENDRWGGGG